MLDVRRLRLLCELDRLGTIAAVAVANAYTPSAVSQQLAVLEREAGVPLLERTGRSVRLTPAAAVLVRHGDAVLTRLEEATAAMAAVAGGVSGTLRIGAFPSAVRVLLPAALVALSAAYPGLELMVTELDPASAPAALHDGVLDVALLNDYDLAPARPDPGLHVVPLLDEDVHLAVPMKLGASRVADLREQPWILATPGTLCHAATVEVCRVAGFTPRARHHADDFATVLALVGAGQGVSLVPDLAVGSLPAGVRLIGAPTRRRTQIACRRASAAHPAVTAFVAAARDAAARQVKR